MFGKLFFMRTLSLSLFLCFFLTVSSQKQLTSVNYLLKPDRVFDGEKMHEGWSVLIKGEKIESIGSIQQTPENTTIIELKGCTLMPGLIEGHSHLLLHPYNETSWNDQVLNESRAERTIRATVHAKKTLLAGFTTVRDLGTEGAMYDDIGLKKSIEKGIIPGPRMLIATRAIVVKGSYGPKSGSADIDFPIGAAEVGGMEELSNEIRTQIGKGADFIKLYADYRWGPDGIAAATFTQEELNTAVQIAKSSGRVVVAHAATEEGMRRSVLAGIKTIEHGDGGTKEIFELMKEKGVAFCPTISAGDAIEQYRGWKKGSLPEPARILQKRKTFRMALDAGVTICMGGDVGVYSHGDNAREMEAMVDYGMSPIQALQSATSVNADVFGLQNKIGRIKTGLLADIVVVEGNPMKTISDIRRIKLVMKGGELILLK